MNDKIKVNFGKTPEYAFGKMPELDPIGYKSPIDIIYGEMQTKVENGVLEAIQKCRINVDKDELIKALRYDRAQYDRGFADGYLKGVKEFAERLKEEFRANTDNNGDINSCYVPDIIDNLVKEMVGDAK